MIDLMKKHIFIVIVTIFLNSLSVAGEFKIDKEFVNYIKKASNPSGLGMRKDGRYYPYSTPLGWRIAFRRRITDKRVYMEGISKETAQADLEKTIFEAMMLLKKYVDKNYSETPYNSLPRKSQFILLDFAVYYGPDKVSDEIYKTVIAGDYDKFIKSFMYVRFIEDCWADNDWNRAFSDKWIYNTKSRK